MRNNLKHQLQYVNFRQEATYTYNISQSQFDELKSTLDEKLQAKSMTKREDWLKVGTWSESYNCDYHKIMIKREDGYYCYTSNTFDDSRNDGHFHNDGVKARSLFDAKFKELAGTSIKQAFGTCPLTLKDNVPASFYYVNRRYAFLNIPHVYKCDFSSNYPSNACGRLPDWNTAMQIDGVAEPTEEYPFAFYLTSHHVAEHGVFDTRKWVKHKLFRELNFQAKQKKFRYIPTKPEDEVTVLCKASKYELTDALNYFYDEKVRGNSDAKLVMNRALGTLHPSSLKSRFPKQHHIACIFIGRSTQTHLNIYDELSDKGNVVLSMIVDCFIYYGKKQIGTPEKYLGSLVSVINDATFRMTSNVNQYAFEKGGKIHDLHHGAIQTDESIEKLEDIDKWDEHRKEKRWQRNVNIPRG